MTSTLSKETPTSEVYPHAVLGKGYSNNELKLIKAIWADTKAVAKSKMQLCINLYQLKQELDANDPNAGNCPTKSRFWAAFEQGDLPEYVTSKRSQVDSWLQAAEFATARVLPGAPGNSLLTLTPSTVCNLSRIKHPRATELAAQHLELHEFIGHDAAAYLAKTDLQEKVLDGIETWIDANPSKALVPSVIRKIEAKVAEAQRKASTPAHLKPRSTAPSSGEVYTPPVITQEQRNQRNQELLHEQNIRDTKEAIEAPEREAAADLQKYHKLYADALANAVEGLRDLKRALNTISAVKGTIYLDELREYQGPLGFNYVQHDVAELRKVKDDLLEIVKLATSRTGPQSIDWETINVEAD